MTKKIKVLYIAGFGRSGSTILDKILSEIDGFFSVGEMKYIWDRGLVENMVCGCGLPFRECKLWTQVLSAAYGPRDLIGLEKMLGFEQKFRTRHILLSLFPRGKQWLSARLGKYPNEFQKLYQAVQSVTGSKVIVDSSKFPSYGYLLAMIPDIDLHIVHLIRDSRASAYSWQRKKYDPNMKMFMPTLSPLQSALSWLAWNFIIELLWSASKKPVKYLQIHYRDFVAQPRAAVQSIVRFVGEAPDDLPFIDGRFVKLTPNHAFSGNPIRSRQGMIEVRPDTQWRSQMKLRHKILVTSITWPLLLRYRGKERRTR